MKCCRLVVIRCITPSMLNSIFNLSLSITQNTLWLTPWSIFHPRLPHIERALYCLQVLRLRLLVFCAKSNRMVTMSKMHWWDGTILTGETEVLAHELFQPVPVHILFTTNVRPGIETGPSRWQAGDWSPKKWHIPLLLRPQRFRHKEHCLSTECSSLNHIHCMRTMVNLRHNSWAIQHRQWMTNWKGRGRSSTALG